MTDMPVRLRHIMGWLGLCVLAWALLSPAVAGEDPYTASVPVADTSRAQRNAAFAKALDEVLARVAGHHLDAASVNGKAATFVEQYQYRRAPDDASEPLLVKVRFAPSSIHHLVDRLSTGGGAVAGASTAENGADHAVADGGGTQGRLWISNLHSALDFAGAVAALHSVPGVVDVGVEQAQGHGALLTLHTSIPLQRVLDELTDGGGFARAGHPHAGARASLRLVK